LFFLIDAITPITSWRIILGSLFGVIGLFSMLSVIKKASLQWLGIYNLIGIAFTIPYLWVFENIEIQNSIIGLSIIVLGFISFIYTNKKKQLKISLKQHLSLLLMTFSFSCSALLHWKNLSLNVPPLLIISSQEFLVFLTGVVFTFKQGEGKLYSSDLIKYFKNVLLMSVVIFLAFLFNLIGLKEINPIITSILFLASPLTTILFSALFFKEKISSKNILFISIIVLGAFILHYQST